jgi:hypothetical protein
MSAYKTIQCDIVDSNILLEALELLNLSATKHDIAKPLRGYRNDVRSESAEIIIDKEKINFYTGSSNDIGFKWNTSTNKYDMIISDYDKKFNMDSRIIQAYVKVVLEKALEKNGFKIKVNIEEELTKKKLHDLDIVARKII